MPHTIYTVSTRKKMKSTERKLIDLQLKNISKLLSQTQRNFAKVLHESEGAPQMQLLIKFMNCTGEESRLQSAKDFLGVLDDDVKLFSLVSI